MDAEIRRQIEISVKSYEKRPAADSVARIAVLEENIDRLKGRDGAALERAAENKMELAGLKVVSASLEKLADIFGEDDTATVATSDDGAV